MDLELKIDQHLHSLNLQLLLKSVLFCELRLIKCMFCFCCCYIKRGNISAVKRRGGVRNNKLYLMARRGNMLALLSLATQTVYNRCEIHS